MLKHLEIKIPHMESSQRQMTKGTTKIQERGRHDGRRADRVMQTLLEVSGG